jgi:hypothetical protein
MWITATLARFSPDNDLYCVAHDEVVAFDFTTANVSQSQWDFPGRTVKP